MTITQPAEVSRAGSDQARRLTVEP